MPFRIPEVPWIKIDHVKGILRCTRCKKRATVSPIAGLEGLVDAVRPFRRKHENCKERTR